MRERGIVRGQALGSGKHEAARRLKAEMTPAERALWQQLRRNQLGLHFRRQQVIGGFVVDFYCAAKRLAVEVDGEIHATTADEDTYRSAVVQAYGVRIVRFTNREVFTQMTTVLARIVASAHAPADD